MSHRFHPAKNKYLKPAEEPYYFPPTEQKVEFLNK